MFVPARFRSAAFAAALALLAGPAAAQEAQESRDVAVRVIDGSSRTPVAGAAIQLAGRDRVYVTDDDGRVTVPDVEGDRIAVLVHQLGYEDLQTTMDVGEAGMLTLELTPRPVLLNEIRIQTDRLRSRRNAVATNVRAFDRQQLLTSAAWDMAEFLRSRAMVHTVPCRGASFHTCAVVRGRVQPVTVYIDEVPLIGGLDFLAMYRPDELYLVEVYGGGRQIRAYTNWFMERVAEGRTWISPVLW